MKKILTSCVLSILAIGSVANANEQTVKEKVNQNFPNLKVESVTFLKDINIYELMTNPNGQGQPTPIYTNENLDFLFLSTGELIDPKNKKNLTVDREIERTKQVFNKLPFNEAFSVKYGTGARKMAVFSDPDCPFCQEMEKDFRQNMKENVTVYYFMNPLKSLHPEAANRAARILCDKSPSTAWVKYTTSAPGLNKNAYASWNPETALPKNNGSCSKAALVEKQYNLSTSFGFSSTPSIIFDNGYVVRDKLSPAQVSQIFAKKQ